MVNFPTTIDVWTDVTDDVSVISDSHMNDAHNEIIAVEQQLINHRSNIRAYRATSFQAITKNVNTLVQFNAEEWDEKGEYSHDSTYLITPEKAGYYLLIAQTRFTSLENGKYIQLQLKQGATVLTEAQTFNNTADGCMGFLSAIVLLAGATDYGIWVMHNSLINKNMDLGISETFFCLHMISQPY